MNKLVLHPLFIMTITWSIVLLLYQSKWSQLLTIDLMSGDIFFYILIIVFTYIAILFVIFPKRTVSKSQYLSDNLLAKTVKLYFIFWCLCSFVEIIYSGGLPLIWSMTGSAKTYFDFGIPSIHGFMNSLISTVTLVSYYLYLSTKLKRYLYLSLIVFVWSIIVISRQLFVVNLLQLLILYSCINRLNLFAIIKYIFIAMILVLGFGYIGDMRSGAKNFISVAQPSDSFPEWLPSGFLWVYMYLVTPLLNLLNTFMSTKGYESFYFANTLSSLFPSIIRNVIYPDMAKEKGDVITKAFNVSTAFIDPYKDMGYIGIILFTIIIAVVINMYWYKTDKISVFIYCVLLQCLVLTVFYNHFLSLPVITQIIWLQLINWRQKIAYRI
jgi:oligosaccharide repeat unit polymerase